MPPELNLMEDSPEEYEGRIVVVAGSRYQIGPLIATGAEAIVHTLINCRSGLSLLIIRIPRDQSSALAVSTRTLEVQGIAKASGLPVANIRVLTLHGGVFEIQDNMNSAEYDRETVVSLDRAMRLYEDGSYQDAGQIYADILQGNPDDTTALTGSAAILVAMGDAWGATRIISKVVSIEPNVGDYYLNYISALCACPYPRAVIETADRMKSLFPYQFSRDDSIIEAHLACGEARRARELLESSRKRFDAKVRSALKKKIRFQLKGAKAAAEFKETARRAVAEDRLGDATCALGRACELDPYDPYLRANHAFTLRRAGEYRSAATLLSSILTTIQSGYRDAIRFNCGLALLQAGDKEIGTQLIVSVAFEVEPGSDGSIAEAELPGAAKWIQDEFIQEERVRTVYAILAELMDTAVDANASWVLQQYARFADER